MARDFLLAALVSVICGLDRTAAWQVMISRPIVAAPLTGWLLGDAGAGLQVGLMTELLWLGRLPMGAAVPPDDTQVAVGASVLAVTVGGWLGLAGPGFTVCAVLVAMPLGKVGQHFDRGVRHWNGRLLPRTELALKEGDFGAIERYHLRGAGNFALGALATCSVIVGGGALLLQQLAPLLIGPVTAAAGWLQVMLPLLGAALILSTINVPRSLTLFAAAFTSALLMLWLV